jgi:branched-chain amino acid aminotransferase
MDTNLPKTSQSEVSLSLLSDDVTGIYESLRVYGGFFFALEEHLDRFYDSARSLGLKIPETRESLRKKIKKEAAGSGQKDAFVRLTLAGNELFIVVTARTHPPEIYKKGVALKTSAVIRNPSHPGFPEAKSTACLNQVLATLDPAPPGNYEIIFLNREGYLTEARIGNFFMVKRGGLFTPPPYGLLNGVTRRFVIECARLGKIDCEEKPVTRHDLFTADEAFLTNTSWEILPVREVDGRQVGSTLPGPVTQKLRRLFRKGVQREIQKSRNGKN